MENLSFWIGIIATVAFAVTGVLAIADRGVDLFGVMVLGLITAIGGGTRGTAQLRLCRTASRQRVPVGKLAAARSRARHRQDRADQHQLQLSLAVTR